MGLFNRKKDVVDLSEMRRKGILPENSESLPDYDTDEDGVVDLSSQPSVNSSSPISSNSVSSNTEDASGLGFLSNLANSENSASPNSTNTDSENNKERYADRLRRARMRENNVGHLHTKIEDIEYKLDRFLERLEKIESNLGL